ncbi:dihydroxyacetone kinase DhaL subunit [Thermomonospora echinospora]|uniref:Dihydroxyacetone kinase DhaL subunit n=1 Tax=Thermomonospora echinospora TaxID=1992 RepID=A0A1H6E1L2_9ACTN|nr:dihydroxyacetone kinase subunit DhaL [Thermomonospora echinospora]SEG91528.1 dihydroxyacetone kinase DhaL subunit [Thermomonospora echinospora]
MTDQLTAADLRRMMAAVADRIIGSEPALNKADRDIGDGDHGLAMTRGFTAVRRLLDPDGDHPVQHSTDVHQVLVTVGDTLLHTMGGASGVIFGLLFRAGARGQEPSDRLGVAGLADHFARSLREIAGRGGAAPGDKTMVDALEPAVRSLAADAARGLDLPTALRHAAEAAADGADSTRKLVARFGKALSLRERALGFPDPGALSTTIIFTAMAGWAEQNATAQEES